MPTRKVSYVDLKVPNRARQATQVLGALSEAGVNLLAFTGFPDRGGKSQIDLVTNDLVGVRRVARQQGWRIGKTTKGFLSQGRDRAGAVHRQLQKLADQRINVIAVDAVAAGKSQFGMILWVKPKDYNRAAKVLRAK